MEAGIRLPRARTGDDRQGPGKPRPAARRLGDLCGPRRPAALEASPRRSWTSRSVTPSLRVDLGACCLALATAFGSLTALDRSATALPTDITQRQPVIVRVRPDSGPATGGTRMTITGADLGGTESVMFGNATARSFTVNAVGSRITAYTPAGAAGTVLITVTRPKHANELSAADEFTYLNG